jgi:hypothetical protein
MPDGGRFSLQYRILRFVVRLHSLDELLPATALIGGGTGTSGRCV